MSYGIGLHFKKINNESEILDLMFNIEQGLNKKSNIKNLLENEKHYLLDRYSECKKLNLVDGKYSKSYLFDDFIQHVFTFRLYYWKQYNLVALCYQSSELPKYLKKIF